MAVDLWTEVTVSRAENFEITAEGLGAELMPKDETNYMVVGLKAAFEAAKKPVPTLKYHVVSRIPFARGLGSSSAGIVSGIVAGLILAGHRLPCWGSEALLQIAASIEVRLLFVNNPRLPDSQMIPGTHTSFSVLTGPPRQCGSRHLWRNPDRNP